MEQWLLQNKRLYLAACVVVCFFTFNGYSHVKVPWVDEVLQLTVARQNSFGEIWSANAHGIIADPPVTGLLQHHLIRTFGERMWVMRMPALVSFPIGCLALTCLAWRYMTPLYAATVFFVPYATMIRWRAMDARSYAPMFACAALALYCLDQIGRPGTRRNSWRAGLVASLVALYATHFYSILILLPIGLVLLARWWRHRAIDWITILCVAAGTSTYLIWLPILMSVARVHLSGIMYRASFGVFGEFWRGVILYPPWLASGILLAALLLTQKLAPASPLSRSPVEVDRPLEPAALSFGFLMMPVVGFAAGIFVTGIFIPYHYILAAVGVVIGFPLAVAVLTRHNRVAGLILLVAFGGYGFAVTVRGATGYVRVETPYPSLADIRKLIPEQKPDIAIPSPLDFLPFQELTRTDPENNLIYLYDAAKARSILHGIDIAEVIALHIRTITKARFEAFDAYVAKHPNFYLAMSENPTGVWMYEYLTTGNRAQLVRLGTAGRFTIYRVQMQNQTGDGSAR